MRARPSAFLIALVLCGVVAVEPALATPTTTTATTTTSTTATTPKAAPVPRVCLKAERAVIAHALGVRVSVVREHQHLAGNAMPQCNYLVHRARSIRPHTRVVVAVNVDNGPQAAWRLMRKNVEASQIFGIPPPGWRRPIGLLGLGPNAGWYPTLD